MDVKVTVNNPFEDKETSFYKFVFEHDGCGKMTLNHDHINHQYRIVCACGLTLSLEEFGEDCQKIAKSVIDRSSYELSNQSYDSTLACTVMVIPV